MSLMDCHYLIYYFPLVSITTTYFQQYSVFPLTALSNALSINFRDQPQVFFRLAELCTQSSCESSVAPYDTEGGRGGVLSGDPALSCLPGRAVNLQ